MAGEYNALVKLAQATEDAQARQLLMNELQLIAPLAGGDNQPADAAAAAVLARIRADAINTLGRLMAATDAAGVT